MEKHGLGMCAKAKLATGYEIRAANWGIIQQRFVQLPAEWCQHVRRSRLGPAEVVEEDQSRRCRNAAVMGDRCGVVSDPKNF
jgi:hypothetical protein